MSTAAREVALAHKRIARALKKADQAALADPEVAQALESLMSLLDSWHDDLTHGREYRP
jgi:hypothetical protein